MVCLAGCAVVSVFGSGDYVRKKKVLVVCLAGCAVVSVFCSGDYDRKKKVLGSCPSGGLCCCVSFWFWREIGSFFVKAGKFYYDRKKIFLVLCLAGCAVVSVFGSGDYDRKKKF